jgi:putative colanic acid biosynthesis UDP-glucose lipid carrier transferase
MGSRFARYLQLTLAALDLLAINAVFFTSIFLFKDDMPVEAYIQYTYFGFFLSVAWVGVTLLTNLYHEKYVVSFEQFTKRTTHAFIFYLLVLSFYLFFFHQFSVSRLYLIVVLTSISISVVVNRFLYLILSHYLKKRDYLFHKVVLIGYNSVSKKLATYLAGEGINKEVIGYCDQYENIDELSLHPILSDVNGAFDVCKKYGATEIYSTISPEQDPNIYNLIQSAEQNCIRFRIVPDISYFIKRQVHIDYVETIPVLSLRREPLEDLECRIRKRLFDIVVSSMVIVFILSWLVPLMSILIKLESKGPIFFKQLRSGKDNNSFLCLKFRSMRINNAANEKQATKNDDRVTRIGRFMRRTSLDEFPQFINVLKGHMSIVGPRPHMLKHTDDYSRLIDQYMVRQFLKPGITGWAQVNGLRGETKTIEQMQKRVEHDIWYMENWSLWLDIKIIFMTVFNTLKGEENAF